MRKKRRYILMLCVGVSLLLAVSKISEMLDADAKLRPMAERFTEEPQIIGTALERSDWAAFLKNLQGSDIANVGWLMERADEHSAEEIAALLRAATASIVSHDDLTLNGSATDIVWTLDMHVGDSDATEWSGEDALHLYAGLEEDVVEIFGGANLPEGRIHVKDHALYQLIRTMMDTPDPGVQDQAAYDAYESTIADFLAQSTYTADGSRVRQELTGFFLVAQNTAIGAKLYQVSSVGIVNPPEQAPQLLSGGAYVDSQLRIHGGVLNNILVVVENTPIGFVNWEWLEIDKGLESCHTQEDLFDAVQRSGKLIVTM